MSWNKKAKWQRSKPNPAANMFKDGLNLFGFFQIIIAGVGRHFGHLSNFMYRIEFQARRSPHAHCFLLMADSPRLDVDSDETVEKY